MDAGVLESRKAQSNMVKATAHSRMADMQRAFNYWSDYATGSLDYADRVRNQVAHHIRCYFLRVGTHKLSLAVHHQLRKNQNERRARAHWLYAAQWDTLADWRETARLRKRFIAKAWL